VGLMCFFVWVFLCLWFWWVVVGCLGCDCFKLVHSFRRLVVLGDVWGVATCRVQIDFV